MRQGRALLIFFALFYCTTILAAYYPPVMAREGMVVSDHYLASEVGAEILKQGGNAMDAAVAVGYALAVVHPCCGNIGGGGFMLVHWHDGRSIVLDFREVAPEKIKTQSFYDKNGKLKADQERGYLFVGVPGTVMGLNEALVKFGTLSLPQVMGPAIRLAKEGFVLNRYDVQNFMHVSKRILRQPNIKAIYMSNGQWLHPGDRLIQKDLAATLEKIATQGSTVFYQGEIAQEIVAASSQDHGVLSLEDFAHYQVFWRKPLQCSYRTYQLLTTPPPGSGVTICEILKLVSSFHLKTLGFHSAAAISYNASAMKQAFYDRNHYLGDPTYVNNPIEWLLSEERTQKIQHLIAENKIRKPLNLSLPVDHMYTTHYVVMDKEKNVVSTTYTINSFFGSVRIANHTGFLLNNDLRDFALKKNHPNLFFLIQGASNLIAPNKRPLSSMSPTLVMNQNEVFMALGAAGGPTIITSIVQAIENVIDYDMDIRSAIDSPRYHMQWWPNVVYWEPFAFSQDTLRVLQKIGYHVQQKLFNKYLYWGQMAGLVVLPNGVINGSSDNRQPNSRAVGISPLRSVKGFTTKTDSKSSTSSFF